MNSKATERLLALQKILISNANTDQPCANGSCHSPKDSREDGRLVLPDGTILKANHLDQRSGGMFGKTLITSDGVPVASYRTLNDRSPVGLILSAKGTPFEDHADHVPKYSVLEVGPPLPAAKVSIPDFWATIYFLFVVFHEQEHVPIVMAEFMNNRNELFHYVLHSGLGRIRPSRQLRNDAEWDASSPPSSDVVFLSRMAFWQGAGTTGFHSRGWLTPDSLPDLAKGLNLHSLSPFPYVPSFTRSELVIAAHPLRPPKPHPGELLYKRYCPSVGKTLELRYFCLDESLNMGSSRHLEAFHRWHNNPRVNSGWGESGTLKQHRQYVAKVLADPAVLPVMMSWDGELMGYLEYAWVKENHMATYIGGGEGGAQARDWDRAIHVLVGEDRYKGKVFSAAWLRSAIHFAFLAEPRTDRVVGEPRLDNDAILEACMNAGLHVETIFDFPYKRSALVITPRERFFKLDLL